MVFLRLQCALCGHILELDLAQGQEMDGFICPGLDCRSSKMLLLVFQPTGNRVIGRILYELESRVNELDKWRRGLDGGGAPRKH